MRLVSTAVGSAICGALAFSIWPEMWKSYGIMGGWLTSAVVISICWYMNHWLGIIWNPRERIWVDQGWGVAAAGVAWAAVRFGAHVAQILPTLICCLIGGSLAGLLAARIKRDHPLFGGAAAKDGGAAEVVEKA